MTLSLPAPRCDGGMPLARALATRRSRRELDDRPLALGELAQLLWAAQGITDAAGLRTAPSAGALFPLELYAAVRRVEGLDPGLYHYAPRAHGLQPLAPGDLAAELSQAALGQRCVAAAAVNIVLAAVAQRTEHRYGSRAGRYVLIEVGHAAQNILLQAAALGLGAVAVGAFRDPELRRTLDLQPEPLYLIAVGRLRS